MPDVFTVFLNKDDDDDDTSRNVPLTYKQPRGVGTPHIKGEGMLDGNFELNL